MAHNEAPLPGHSSWSESHASRRILNDPTLNFQIYLDQVLLSHSMSIVQSHWIKLELTVRTSNGWHFPRKHRGFHLSCYTKRQQSSVLVQNHSSRFLDHSRASNCVVCTTNENRPLLWRQPPSGSSAPSTMEIKEMWRYLACWSKGRAVAVPVEPDNLSGLRHKESRETPSGPKFFSVEVRISQVSKSLRKKTGHMSM